MKYISLVIFAVLLSWTWSLIHHESNISFETHAGIQEKLAQLIQKTVGTRKPEAQNIIIEKIWTEPQEAQKVLAHFIYSFEEKSTDGKVMKSQITGQGILQKQVEDGSGLERWALLNIKTTNDAVQFEDGLMVTPGGDEPSTESSVTTPAQPEGH